MRTRGAERHAPSPSLFVHRERPRHLRVGQGHRGCEMPVNGQGEGAGDLRTADVAGLIESLVVSSGDEQLGSAGKSMSPLPSLSMPSGQNGLGPPSHANGSLVVPDFTITRSISSPASPSIEQSRLSTSSCFTTRPSAYLISTCEMSSW
jgi:hypothetical protein